MQYYLAPHPEFPDHGLYSLRPFVVILDQQKTVSPHGVGGTSKHYIKSFDTLTEAYDFRKRLTDPDREPRKMAVYGHSYGQWLEIAFEAEEDGNTFKLA